MSASTNWDPPSRLCFPSSTAWSLCHQLGSTLSTWDTSTLVILEFSDAINFIGEVSEDNISSGVFRACVSGTLRGNEIRWQQAACVYGSIDEKSRWQLATLDLMGTFGYEGKRIGSGRIRSAHQFHVDSVLRGIFTARRVPLRQRSNRCCYRDSPVETT